jgi:hypothetical protein
LEEEEFKLESEDMEDNKNHGEEEEKPLHNNQPWLVGYSMAILG